MRSQAITTYSPEAEIRRPGLLLRNMLRDVRSSRELAWRLAQRDIKVQYRQSYLGYLWAFITPLITTVPWGYVNVSGGVLVESPIPQTSHHCGRHAVKARRPSIRPSSCLPRSCESPTPCLWSRSPSGRGIEGHSGRPSTQML